MREGGDFDKMYGVNTDLLEQKSLRSTDDQYDHNGDRWEDLQSMRSNAVMNDFDTRMSLRDASMSGNKKAQKIIDDGNYMNAHQFMEKTHRKQLGATGKYSSWNDKKNVSGYW